HVHLQRRRLPPKDGKNSAPGHIARERCLCPLRVAHFGAITGRFLWCRGRLVTGPPRTPSSGRLLGGLQVDRLGSLAALVWFGFEGDAHAFIERADFRALHGGDMDEDVLAPLVRRDEAESLRLIEELDSSSLPHARSPCPRENCRTHQLTAGAGEAKADSSDVGER